MDFSRILFSSGELCQRTIQIATPTCDPSFSIAPITLIYPPQTLRNTVCERIIVAGGR